LTVGQVLFYFLAAYVSLAQLLDKRSPQWKGPGRGAAFSAVSHRTAIEKLQPGLTAAAKQSPDAPHCRETAPLQHRRNMQKQS